MTANEPKALPRGLMFVINLGILFHLFALGILVLAAPSGPWPTNFGSSMALAPTFAGNISEVTTRYYLQPLHLSHNYHFGFNRTNQASVFIEAHVWDSQGGEKILKLPDPRANAWVRQRQSLLAQNIGEDQPFQPRFGEAIPAPGQTANRVKFFYPPVQGSENLELFEGKEYLLPRDRPTLYRPTDWTLLLARSYGRFLHRQYGATKVELVRHSREPISPVVILPNPNQPGKLLVDTPPPGTFETLVCNFGDGQPREWRLKE